MVVNYKKWQGIFLILWKEKVCLGLDLGLRGIDFMTSFTQSWTMGVRV